MISRIRLASTTAATNIELTTANFNFTSNPFNIKSNVDIELSTQLFNFAANDLEWFVDYVEQLTTSNFSFNAIPFEIKNDFDRELSTANFNINGIALGYASSDISLETLTTANFNIIANSLEIISQFNKELTTQAFNITSDALGVFADYKIDLTTQSFGFTGIPLEVYTDTSQKQTLTTENFKFNANEFNMAGLYTLQLETSSGTYGAGGLVIALGGNDVASIHADGTHQFLILAGALNTDIVFKCLALNDFIGDVDNVVLQRI